jgi:hypothetical protein
MRRACNVFVGKAGVLLASAAMATNGFEIDTGPVVRLAADISWVATGAAVLEAKIYGRCSAAGAKRGRWFQPRRSSSRLQDLESIGKTSRQPSCSARRRE